VQVLLGCLSAVFLQACVRGMFEYKDFPTFKQHLRDFLVQTKAFATQDNAALFADEQAQLKEVNLLNVDTLPLCKPK